MQFIVLRPKKGYTLLKDDGLRRVRWSDTCTKARVSSCVGVFSLLSLFERDIARAGEQPAISISVHQGNTDVPRQMIRR